MTNFSFILIYFFVIFLNNSFLILTLKSGRKLDLVMRKEKKSKLNDTFIYNAKTKNQEKYIDYLNEDTFKLIIAVGPAGTGKTLFACLKAISQLKNGEINKLIVTRPVVTVEEDIGFLPGNIVKKMDPWTRPIFDLFLEFFSKSELDNYINSNVIEISPLAFMRGRTFKNSFIIADEMQNSSPNQMKMLTTRIGINSKMVITGDLKQSDIQSENGLYDLVNKINIYNKYLNESNKTDALIRIIDFEKQDIERSEIVKKIIDIYDFDVKTMNTTKMPLNKTFQGNNVTSVINTTNNITNTTNVNNNNTTPNENIKSDAALIPKHHIPRNVDIFFADS
jgi:phosphate starvation-inducible PhoH-like protein